MKNLLIGGGVSVNAIEYASRANAILGIRDSGKTFTATGLAEQLHELAIPFFAFDPIGRWRFLRTPGSGQNARGFPVVVLGGAAPDLPLTPDQAPKMVRAAISAGVSAVIDLYDVKLSKADWRKIVRECIEVILYENEALRGGLRHVFLEEAAEFIPQHVRDGNTYAAVEKLARMGGNAGVGVTVINQRAEEVNKAVLELCDNLLLHRQRGKNSLLSLRKWLEAGNVKPPRAITDSLADLPTGECWAWFKDLGAPRRVRVLAKRSFDPNRRAMSAKEAPRATAAMVDVTAWVAKMKAALAGRNPANVGIAKIIDATLAEKGEAQVNEKEAQKLRDDNEKLRATNAALGKRIADLEGLLNDGRVPIRSPQEIQVVDDAPRGHVTDALFAEFKRRLLADPGVVAAIARSRPEIEVTVTRRQVAMTEMSLIGRLAKLIAEGFFDGGRTASAAHTELQRLGRGSAKPNVYRECDKLAEMGFLTKEENGYRAVDGMKINVIEA